MMNALLYVPVSDLRRYWIPRTPAGWFLFIAMFGIIAGLEYLGKRFFPNLHEGWRRIIEIALLVIFLFIIGADTNEL